MNIDKSEIAKFEQLAHKWWDKESEFKPLHEINPLRVNWINERVDLKDKKILDIGCGGGILTEALYQRGAQVVGIDMAEASLSVAKIHQLESGSKIKYQQITAEELAQSEQNEYDIITCLEMLEHVPNPESIIQACNKLLKPKGHAFFSTINRNLKAYTLAIIGAEYILKLLPKGTHDYKKFIRPSELGNWIRNQDLNIQDIIGLTYNPITKNYKLSKDIDVNYMLHSIKN